MLFRCFWQKILSFFKIIDLTFDFLDFYYTCTQPENSVPFTILWRVLELYYPHLSPREDGEGDWRCGQRSVSVANCLFLYIRPSFLHLKSICCSLCLSQTNKNIISSFILQTQGERHRRLPNRRQQWPLPDGHRSRRSSPLPDAGSNWQAGCQAWWERRRLDGDGHRVRPVQNSRQDARTDDDGGVQEVVTQEY